MNHTTRTSGVLEAGRDGVGQLVGPGIGAEVESGVAEAGVRLMGQKIDARKTALRKLIPAGEGNAVLSGAKLAEVDHLALSNTVSSFRFSVKRNININGLNI